MTAIFCAGLCFAVPDVSEETASLVDSFFDLRMNLSLIDGDTEPGMAEILAAIDDFAARNSEKIAALSEQDRIVIDNFIIMERYNYLYGKEGQAKMLREMLGAQREKCESFAKSAGDDALSSYFFCTWADITSCYMVFSISDVLKYATGIEPLYKKALQKYPDFSYILTNIGQYYYFAPKIAGGSKKKTLEFFEQARALAITDAQKYFADIFLSQLLYERKEFARCEELLSEAESFCHGSYYIAKIRRANENGLSLYQYNRKKSSLDEKSN